MYHPNIVVGGLDTKSEIAIGAQDMPTLVFT